MDKKLDNLLKDDETLNVLFTEYATSIRPVNALRTGIGKEELILQFGQIELDKESQDVLIVSNLCVEPESLESIIEHLIDLGVQYQEDSGVDINMQKFIKK